MTTLAPSQNAPSADHPTSNEVHPQPASGLQQSSERTPIWPPPGDHEMPENPYLYGHSDFNGLEVVPGTGPEVVKAEHNEQETNTRVGWRKRKICGIPVLALIALAALLVIGAAVGGGVGGMRSRTKGPPSPPRSTRTAAFEFPLENQWYNIVNDFSGTRKFLSTTGDGETVTGDKVVVVKSADTAHEQWSFLVARNATVKSIRSGPYGTRYWISNRFHVDKPYRWTLGAYPKIHATAPGELTFQPGTQGSWTNTQWYWVGEWGSDGTTSLALVNENFTTSSQFPAWAVTANDSGPVRLVNYPERENALPGAAYWYLESAKPLVIQPSPMYSRIFTSFATATSTP